MNIVIVDDSAEDRVRLANDITSFARENTVMIRIFEYENGELFLKNAHINAIDVVFLDIYMEHLNGIDVAYKLHEINPSCQVVFVTTSAEFAVQSYQVRAFHYILKPYEQREIYNVMKLLDESSQKSSRYIKVKESREWHKIFLSDILYVDYNNHYVQIHTEEAIISTYIKFPEIEEKLLVYSEFLSCYRCIVINMDKIKKSDGFFFLLCNGEYIPINRKRVKEIKAVYMDFVFGIQNNNCQDWSEK